MQQEEKRLILEFMKIIIRNMSSYDNEDMKKLEKIIEEFEKTGK